jgi:F0F1-type ATP synthase membrane subunit b/b'
MSDPMGHLSAKAWESLFPEVTEKARAAQKEAHDAIRAQAFNEAAALIESRIQTYDSALDEAHKHVITRLNHERRTLIANLHHMAENQ